MIIYEDKNENLIYLVYRLNPEIEELYYQNEIYLDYLNNRIEMTQNAFEKITYYLWKNGSGFDLLLKERINNMSKWE